MRERFKNAAPPEWKQLTVAIIMNRGVDEMNRSILWRFAFLPERL